MNFVKKKEGFSTKPLFLKKKGECSEITGFTVLFRLFAYKIDFTTDQAGMVPDVCPNFFPLMFLGHIYDFADALTSL